MAKRNNGFRAQEYAFFQTSLSGSLSPKMHSCVRLWGETAAKMKVNGNIYGSQGSGSRERGAQLTDLAGRASL